MAIDRVLYRYLTGVSPSLFRAWMRNADIELGDMPQQVREVRARGTSDASPDPDISQWLLAHADVLTAALLRNIDIPDDDVAELITDEMLPQYPSYGVDVTFTFGPHDDDVSSDMRSVNLVHLAVASTLYTEMYLAVASAHRAFGLVLPPPRVVIRRGSVQFGTSGALLPVAIGILLATGTGAIALPLGVAGGGVLALVGVYDTYLGWRKTIAERTKLEAEAAKLRAEAAKLQAEAEKLSLEAQSTSPSAQRSTQSRVAYSAAVPRERLREVGDSLAASEAYVAHVLNRALPAYATARQYTETMTYEFVPTKPQPTPQKHRGRRLTVGR